jgi:hypothetical protein
MNAMTEFLEFVKDLPDVVCAEVEKPEKRHSSKMGTIAALPCNYTTTDWATFCHSLDFDYEEGWGCQEFYGFIWFADGSWADRRGHEHGDASWWELQKCPEIPASLKGEKES